MVSFSIYQDIPPFFPPSANHPRSQHQRQFFKKEPSQKGHFLCYPPEVFKLDEDGKE